MKKLWKKPLCLITAACMMFSSAACSSGDATAGEGKQETGGTAGVSTAESPDTATAGPQETAGSTKAAGTPAAADTSEETAATSAEEQEASAETEEDVFAQWNKDAESLNTLIDYVEDITDESSENFIPAEDRIAVFDMDGTLYAELFPTYIEYYMFAWRVLADPYYDPTDESMIKTAETIRDCAIDKSYPDDMPMEHALAAARAYEDMTLEEFTDYATQFFLRDADGFEGMTCAEAIYQPMTEVIEYLNDNSFTCYVVSGSDRTLCRVLLEGLIEVPTENIIGMDILFEASGQGNKSGLDYVYSEDDDVIRTDVLLVKNLNMNKVSQIVMDIGKQPVLSFGNTSGDVSMHNYTLFHNKYKSAAFMLIADDEERDYGNTKSAEEKAAAWKEDGYNVISMKNDFKTIYGDNVKKTGTFRWKDELSGEKAAAQDLKGTLTGIDYKVLVNKLHPLPDNWEDLLETVHFTNSVGDDVEVETKAYNAYLLLKEELEKEGIYIDLDSAYRSVADQQRIMDEFTEQYGKDYALKTVAQPGCSEHHTGLALDLYLIIDGQNITENEDLVTYPEIWAKIHEKLSKYGFILRYLEDREHITGYGQEPWHIRYIDDPAAAGQIMDEGITFEGYLGVVNETNVVIDYGSSELFTPEELDNAAIQIKCAFAGWNGCELHRLSYTGDDENTKENLEWLNSLSDNTHYTKLAKFSSEFYTSPSENENLMNNLEIKDYPWWLGMTEDGSWDIVTTGE